MSIQTINIGNLVNDGLGDDLRTAFRKVNENFSDLSNTLTITASNIEGSLGEGIFKEKNGSDLEFKKLVPGNNITLSSNDQSITINSTFVDSFTSITTNSGSIVANKNSVPSTLDITIQGSTSYSAPVNGQTGRNIKVIKTGDKVISVDTVLDLHQILLSFDFGPITGKFDHPLQLALAAANIDFGTITNPGRQSLDLGGI
jgi:hypothetical protein